MRLVRDLARDTQKVGVGKIDQALPDEGEVGGHFRAFIAARGFGHLHDDLVALFQVERFCVRRYGRTVVLGIVRVRFFHRKVTVFIQTAGDERRVHTRENVGHSPLINIADRFPALFRFRGEFRKLSVFQQGGKLLTAITVEKPFLFHQSLRLSQIFLITTGKNALRKFRAVAGVHHT